MRLISILSLFLTVGLVLSCGIVTHIEISHRATQFFDGTGTIDYAALIAKHQDALIAGSPYPDAFYGADCVNAKYHEVSEDTHWAPFLNTSVNYIRAKYPQPWDEATEKLVVFLFGVVSHQVADIVWHSLGIDQGFLATMGNVNFHGSFSAAHSVGDLGGDILTMYEMNTSYIPLTQGWYIPTDDLWNIYVEYYQSTTKIPKTIVEECTLALFLGRLAEQLLVQELYPMYAKKSPFLVDQFERYFLGGLDDMAGWTHRLWQEMITMLDKGTQACDIPKSTLFLSCNPAITKMASRRNPGTNGIYTNIPLKDIGSEDFSVKETLRGIRVKPTKKFMDKLSAKKKEAELKLNKHHSSDVSDGPQKQPDRTLYVKTPYAKLGTAYAFGDLNFDGKEDVVITAPQYSTMGSPQEGRVYIVYGNGDGLPDNLDPDLDKLEENQQGQILRGWGTAQSRFGSSVAVLDINLDGAQDIAVGAPALVNAGDDPLNYHGSVLVYFGQPAKKCVAKGAANITIACAQKYCNLGYSVTAADVDMDTNLDLVVGSPFYANGTGAQRGYVGALKASKYNTGYQYMMLDQLPWHMEGNQDYGWFGYDFTAPAEFNYTELFVSQPEYRKCFLENCTYSDSDVQAVGRLQSFSGYQHIDLRGSKDFSQLGWSYDVGHPYPNSSVSVLAVADIGADVSGKVAGVDVVFDQTGRVMLYNYTIDSPPTLTQHKLEGDRAFERFGSKLKFFDLNSDGMSDLVVGAPHWSVDITEELLVGDQGLVYIYNGGQNFPYDLSKADCGNSLVHPCPRLQASYVLEWTFKETQTRFGSNFGFIQGSSRNQLLVTAEHASIEGRMSGAVGVFNFKHSKYPV